METNLVMIQITPLARIRSQIKILLSAKEFGVVLALLVKIIILTLAMPAF